MSFDNCLRCKKLFHKISGPLCAACEAEEEKLFDEVKKYLDENRGCTIGEVSEATGVSIKKLMKYLKEGRLEPSEGMGKPLDCENCGKKVRTGRYCERCLIEVGEQINDAFAQNFKKTSLGMHSKR